MTGTVLTMNDLHDRPTVTVTEAAQALGISRAHAYNSVRSGDLPSLRVGDRLLIPTRPLLQMLGALGTTD